MSITPPNFAKNAVPTLKGWCHPKTNELLKSQRITQQQIDEFYGNTVNVEETVEVIRPFSEEKDTVSEDLQSLTKKQLEEYADSLGMELEGNFSKRVLLEKINEFIQS